VFGSQWIGDYLSEEGGVLFRQQWQGKQLCWGGKGVEGMGAEESRGLTLDYMEVG